MFDDACARKFDMVLFWSLDRLSRKGVAATLNHPERLTGYGVGWRSHIEEYLGSTGLFKDAVVAILATIAKQGTYPGSWSITPRKCFLSQTPAVSARSECPGTTGPGSLGDSRTFTQNLVTTTKSGSHLDLSLPKGRASPTLSSTALAVSARSAVDEASEPPA
jgi:hypothetical protein